ncbi:MAG: signal protein [Actinomycetota bacterium]|nr:signal protein [Actinomycetota bacterium]
MSRRRLALALGCLLAAVGCTAEGPQVTTDGTAVMVENGFDVTDMALVQSTWWTWAASAPEETNPVSDTTGEHCDRGQQVGVWLLAGSFGETVTRRCTVPADVPLVGPAVNFVAGTRADCEEFMRDAHGTVTLGKQTLTLDEADPVPITYRAVAGNPVTGEGGEFEGYACGLWFSQLGLAPGAYHLTIEGGAAGFDVSVTYELTVKDT